MLAEGTRSSVRYTGEIAKPQHPLHLARERHGDSLGFRAVLLQIKCDLVDAAKTHGFPSSLGLHHPCIWCKTCKHMLHEDYSECSPLQLPWPLPANGEYDQFCSDQLKTVFVSTPQDRRNISHHLTYTAGKCHWGRCIILKPGELSRVADYDLHHGVVSPPSPEVQDIGGKFEQVSLPFVANFWSAKLDEKGRLQQFCRRPNPLMAPPSNVTSFTPSS